MLHAIAWHLRDQLARAGLCQYNMHPIQGTPGFYRTEQMGTETINGKTIHHERQYGRNKDGVEFTVDRTVEW